MVNIQRAEIETGQKDELYLEAEQYLDQAIQFLKPYKTRLLAIGGLSGTGKSTLASEITPHIGNCCGALLLRSDLERKNMFNVAEYEHLPDEAYSSKVSYQVYHRMFVKACAALKQGQSVVLDAVFANPEERGEASLLANEIGIPFCGIWLTAPDRILIERVRARLHDASDANEGVVTKQITNYLQFSAELSTGWHEVDASGSMENTLANAQKWINTE